MQKKKKVKSIIKKIVNELDYTIKKSINDLPLLTRRGIIRLALLLNKEPNNIPSKKINNSVKKSSKLNQNFNNEEINTTIIVSYWEALEINGLIKMLEKNQKKGYEIIIINEKKAMQTFPLVPQVAKAIKLKLLTTNSKDKLANVRNLAANLAQGKILVFADNKTRITLTSIDAAVKELKQKSTGCVSIPSNSEFIHESGEGKWFKYQDTVEYDKTLNAYSLITKDTITLEEENRLYKHQLNENLVACKRSDFIELGGFSDYFSNHYSLIEYFINTESTLNKRVKIYFDYACNACNRSEWLRERSISYSLRNYKDTLELNKKWKSEQKYYYLKNLLESNNAKLNVGIIVTENVDSTHYGDYFTALELSIELKVLGWNVELVPVKGAKSRYQYDMSGFDCVINLLHDWDINKAYNCKPSLVKICWMRNWIESWVKNSNFLSYDVFLGSSKKACAYAEERTGETVHLFRIAGSHQRFTRGENNKVDCLFTGNYWNEKRDIESFRPNEKSIEFKIYGKGWDKHPYLARYSMGSKKYFELPELYQRSKILIDDANHVTKEWGSANSRIYDGILSGNLVITNSIEASIDVFNGILPSYSNTDELNRLIIYYLSRPKERIKLVNKLRKMVLDHHTYRSRSIELRRILLGFVKNENNISIKTPVPNSSENHTWGDFHYAYGIAKELRKKNWQVRIDPISYWYQERCIDAKTTINLKGLSKYIPNKKRFNLVWIISHPERINARELQEFDHIFVASHLFKEKLVKAYKFKNITTLLQCTDPSIFFIKKEIECSSFKKDTILFVGNSRKVLRPIVKDAISLKVNLQVYGSGWKKLIADSFVKGEHIQNKYLNSYYQYCGILLNDHWESMRKEGFISNRLFDGLAAGATIVSDQVSGMNSLFGDSIYEYDGTIDDLRKKISLALQERGSPKRLEIKNKVAEYISKYHSFEARSKEILFVLKESKNKANI